MNASLRWYAPLLVLCGSAATVVAEGRLSGVAERWGLADLSLPAVASQAAPRAAPRWRLEMIAYDTGVPLVGRVPIRAGFLEESPDVPFRGSILYLQGLGDSMLNHDPLFFRLSAAGYRVVSFDYMGQGGSGGTMNHTRVLDAVFPSLQISTLAEMVWQRHRRPGPAGKIVMGWSTGGLAAYELARRGAADAVILLAPGIHTKLVVGEKFIITLPSLTRADYSRESNPHVDPIRPASPLLAPLFAKNLVASAVLSRRWTVPAGVRGLVLLSGEEDTYVNGPDTKATLSRKAPHFRVVTYEKARHEIDNEVREIRESAAAEILSFLGKPD